MYALNNTAISFLLLLAGAGGFNNLRLELEHKSSPDFFVEQHQAGRNPVRPVDGDLAGCQRVQDRLQRLVPLELADSRIRLDLQI